MTTNPKLTSLAKVMDALADTHWAYAINDSAQVHVKDYDAPDIQRNFGRARYVPSKLVEGVEVKAGNNHGLGFTAKFTKEGAYLADTVSGGFPFSKGMTLSKLLAEIEKGAPALVEARIAANKAREAAHDQAEQEAVAAAHARAKMDLLDKQAEAVTALLDLGLTEEQAEAVLAMASANGNVLSKVAAAAAHVEHTGQGWGRGNHTLHGTYRNGIRLTDEEAAAERQAQQSASIAALGSALAR